MSVRIGLAVIGWPHDPWRRQALSDLRARLGEEELAAYTTGWADFSDWDRLGQWPNERRAWLFAATRRGATHAMVMNDDIHPCRGFLAAAASAAALAPDALLCWMGNRKASRAKAREAGAHWVRSADGAWGGALVVPAAWALGMVRYADAHVPADLVRGDHRPVWYALSRQQPIHLAVPSVMEHVGAGHSALPAGKSLNSVASDFVGFSADAQDIDWTAGLTREPYVDERPTGRLYKLARDLSPEKRRAAGLDWMVKG